MLFDFTNTDQEVGDTALHVAEARRWGVDSEYGRLLDVMLSPPPHLQLVPCNAVAIAHHESGVSCRPDLAVEQHARLVAALEGAGVRCHVVPAAATLPDLSFTRDATLMTPWGLLGLNPAARHRIPEVDHVRAAARSWGVPLLGTIENGFVEGGDVCLVRPGLVAIGHSGERTNEAGARSLMALFEARGWRAILTRFSPEFLHLDTQFTMVSRDRALACRDTLGSAFLEEMGALGIDLVTVTVEEVRRLGANVLSLGDGRVLSSADNRRVNGELQRLGHQVIPVDIGQFALCGGGIHCLSMPLARLPG